MSPISRSLLLLLACASCADAMSREAGPSEPGVPVRLAPVELRSAAPPVQVSGVVAARDELPLAFKIGGVVRSVAVESGAEVKAGQILATLDTVEVDARVSQARDVLAKADRDLERVATLHAERAVPLQVLQDAETARDVARAGARAAEFDRRYAVIVAPTAGRIMARHHEPGELVAPGTPIVDFASAGRGWVVRVGVSDRDVVRLAEGDSARLTLAAYPGVVFSATVREIAGASQPRTGTYEVELAFAPGERRVLTGMIARATIEPQTTGQLPFVPMEALLEADGHSGCVFTLDDAGVARRVPIEIAFVDEPRVAVASGLAGVARVVTDGAAYLRDGTAVRVVP